VLEELVGVDGVEALFLDREGVRVAGAQLEVGEVAGLAPGDLDHLGGAVDADHPPRGEAPRQVDGDRPRPAAHVEQLAARGEPLEQVGRRVRRGPPPVGAQHTLVVAVGVGLGHRPCG
jgi:hypothetical protein